MIKQPKWLATHQRYCVFDSCPRVLRTIDGVDGAAHTALRPLLDRRSVRPQILGAGDSLEAIPPSESAQP